MPASLSNLSPHQRALERVGTTVYGKYRINRLLGVGGMAAVYAATHRNGHRVAIKFLLDHLLDDEGICRLFAREAYVANRVGHPGAVSVLDDGEDEDGCPFLIMPLLEGETLRARWERNERRLSLAEVCISILDVLDVLASAHAKGIVHRDIKPDNLFVTAKGEVRVLDFGIARRVQGVGSTTVTGRLIGTPAFMPPEQAVGEQEAVGPHSDCWAVGATIFTLLSGEFVHQADGAGAQLAAAATQNARSLTEILPDLPAPVLRVVDKALAFDPANRWGSAGEMSEALKLASEQALGEPLAIITTRTRAELIADLLPYIDDAAMEETQRPERERRHDAPEQPARSSRKGDRVPTVMAAGLAERAGQRKARRLPRARFVFVAALALGSALLAAWWSKPTGRAPSATEPSANAAAQDEPASSNAEALAQLRAGIQNWRDTSMTAAQKAFARAIELDPNLAEPSLYSAMVPSWTDEEARANYHVAYAHRSTLRGRDLALLEAYAPAMEVPPDLELTEQRLRSVREKFPSDWLALHALAFTEIRIAKLHEALQVVEELLHQEPSLGLAWMDKGLALGILDDVNGARDALNECTRVSSGESCLDLLIRLDANEGRCSDVERNARKLVSIPQPAPWGGISLAGALYSRGAPAESVHDVLARAFQLLPEPRREIGSLRYEAHFDALTGAFVPAQAVIAQWDRALANQKYEDSHGWFAEFQSHLAMELGDRSLAVRLASAYLAKREAWLGSPYFDWEIMPLRIQYLAGGLSREAFAKRRQLWLERQAARPPLADVRSMTWLFAYAEAVATPEDAADALRALPNYLPIINATARDVDFDDAIGYMYLQHGDVDKALPYLRRGASSCQSTVYPFEQTWANLHLGMALERSGDSAAACKAYNVVLNRWGKEPRSVSANMGRKRVEALHCPRPPSP